MPPSPAMRCFPGREMRVENHKRGRSFESGILCREKDDDLALFNEVQSRERHNFLLQSNDDFEDLFSNKLRYFSDDKLGVSIPARGESSDLLNVEGDKNDYDWLLTPPETPLFPSLDDETPSVNLLQRGRARSQPISISRSSTMEKSHRSSRGSASPNRLSPSPRSSHSVYQSRGRPSSGPHLSPPSGVRPATPTRRLSPPPSKSSIATPRSSTQPPRRMSTGSTGPAAQSRVRGNSPVKTNRGGSASPKIKVWHANIPGFPSEAPPNLRTSLSDLPASYVRGSSPASRNGSKSGRQSMSPTASRSVCSSYSHDRFSSHSKGSVASSGDDDIDSLQSLPMSSSDHSAPRSIGMISNGRGLTSPKKPSKILTSSSAPKRSFDIAIRQMDHRKGPHNMFRPLLSSVPSSTFYVGKSSATQRSIISRNSSVTTSSNASSDLGTSCAHDTEGCEQNQEDITSECVKVPSDDMQEVFAFDNTDCINEKSGDGNHEKQPPRHEELDRHAKLYSQVVGGERFVQTDAAMSISVASEDLDARGDLSDGNVLGDIVLCSRCGSKFRISEGMDENLKLCTDCRQAEINAVLMTSSKSIIVGENSQAFSTFNHETVDASPCPVESECCTVAAMGESETGCYRNPSGHILSEGTGVQDEQIVVNQQVWSETTGSSSTKVGEDIVDQRSENTSGYSNANAGVSEGVGISLLLTSSSGKGPIVRTRTFTATSITCDDFSYLRDSATSTRSSFGCGTASASSSFDLGSAKQLEGRVHRQISSRMSDTETYHYELHNKHHRSDSSLSGASTYGLQASSFVASSHEENLEGSATHLGKDNLEFSRAALQDVALASESIELDNASTDIESDNNCRNISELSSHAVNIHSGDAALVSKFEDALLEYAEDLTNDSQSGINIEIASSRPETCTSEDETLSHAIDRVDVSEAPNLSTLDAISELESENDHVVSPDSVIDIDSQNSKSSIDDVLDTSNSVPCTNDLAASVEESINPDHAKSVPAKSSVMLEGIHSRSLTLEEATDAILFCSAIVHNLGYEAANVAIEKENSALLDSPRPIVALAGKSNLERRECRGRTMSKRHAKSQKVRQRRLETDSMPPPDNSATDEKSEVSTTRIVGVPNKGDSMKPLKLESKCNCTIM